jgi:hypothetical protein
MDDNNTKSDKSDFKLRGDQHEQVQGNTRPAHTVCH